MDDLRTADLDVAGHGTQRSAAAPERRAMLVVNTRSRHGGKQFREAERLLAARGWALDAAHEVADPKRIPDIVADAVEEGKKFIVVGGGDGTISATVGRLAGRDVVLGLLPLGTANSFAKALGLPLALEQAVDVLTDGTVATIDLGILDGRHFANAVAIGLPADIARGTPHLAKRWIGRAGYMLAAIPRVLRHRAFRCTIRHDGGTSRFDALDLRVANGGYQGGVPVVPEADVESRDLIVRVIKGPGRRALVRTWLRAARGQPPHGDDVAVLRTREVSIETDPPQHVSVDGEVVACTPIRVAVAAKALRVMVPADRPRL